MRNRIPDQALLMSRKTSASAMEVGQCITALLVLLMVTCVHLLMLSRAIRNGPQQEGVHLDGITIGTINHSYGNTYHMAHRLAYCVHLCFMPCVYL